MIEDGLQWNMQQFFSSKILLKGEYLWINKVQDYINNRPQKQSATITIQM